MERSGSIRMDSPFGSLPEKDFFRVGCFFNTFTPVCGKFPPAERKNRRDFYCTPGGKNYAALFFCFFKQNTGLPLIERKELCLDAGMLELVANHVPQYGATAVSVDDHDFFHFGGGVGEQMLQTGFGVGGHQAVDIHLHHGGSGFGNFHGSAFFLVFD